MNLRPLMLCAAVAVLLAAVPSVLFAQAQGAGGQAAAGSIAHRYRSPYSGALYYLGNEQVKKELELVEQQQEKLKKLQEETTAKMRRMYSALRDVPREERTKRYYEKLSELTDEVEKQINEILVPHQQDRLMQLKLQLSLRQRGAMYTLGQKDLAEALNITPEQQQKLREQREAMNKKLMEEYRRLRSQYQQELLESVLTPGQLAELEKLTGEKLND